MTNWLITQTIRFKAAVFLFSSRSRHTRLQGDWSSDVCSSDLPDRVRLAARAPHAIGARAAGTGLERAGSGRLRGLSARQQFRHGLSPALRPRAQPRQPASQTIGLASPGTGGGGAHFPQSGLTPRTMEMMSIRIQNPAPRHLQGARTPLSLLICALCAAPAPAVWAEIGRAHV